MPCKVMSIIMLGCSFYHSLKENATEIAKDCMFPTLSCLHPIQCSIRDEFQAVLLNSSINFPTRSHKYSSENQAIKVHNSMRHGENSNEKVLLEVTI